MQKCTCRQDHPAARDLTPQHPVHGFFPAPHAQGTEDTDRENADVNVMLGLQNVRKEYENRCVLDIAALDFRKGASYILVGSNGAGKTTLLRLAAGLENPTAGTIVRHVVRREIILCFQRPYLFRGSVHHNLVYGLRVRRQRGGGGQDMTDLVQRFGLEKILHQDAKRLSAGETQRVALVRALLCRPRLLLLDEPTANLDARSKQALLETIDDIVSEGRTVVTATHLPLGTADKAVAIQMDAGTIVG